VDGLQGIISAPLVGKVQSHQPAGLDIAANDRFRHSAPSWSREKFRLSLGGAQQYFGAGADLVTYEIRRAL
jgi:hypothetical protein